MPANGRWDLIRRLKVNSLPFTFYILSPSLHVSLLSISIVVCAYEFHAAQKCRYLVFFGEGEGGILVFYIYIWYMIYLTAIGLTPVAVVQYTFTHKQYIEQHNRHKTIHRTTQFPNYEECGPCPGRVQTVPRHCVSTTRKHSKL